MNKNDLIAAVADKTGMSKAGAGQAVDATFDAITDALKMGDDVKIIGFGNFDLGAGDFVYLYSREFFGDFPAYKKSCIHNRRERNG